LLRVTASSTHTGLYVTHDLPAITLSDDELRLVPWLPTPVSFADIGERLGTPASVVKSLAIAIYGKLGVVCRQDAVDTCIRLGLLPPNQELPHSSVEDLDEAFFQMGAVRDEGGQIVDFVYEYCNPAALSLLRRAREEVIGRRLLELFPSHVTDGLFEAYVAVTETGEPLRYEFFFDEGGVSGDFEVVVSRHGDGYVLAGHDISVRKRQERDLLLVREQLQQALTSRVVIEQAKGYAAALSGTDPETAFLALRRHARDNNKRLTEVAQSVVTGDLEIANTVGGAG